MMMKTMKELPVPLFGSSRFALCLMNGIALLFLYLLQANISLTIVCMVRKSDARVPSSVSSNNNDTTTTTRTRTRTPATSGYVPYTYEQTDDALEYDDVTTRNMWSKSVEEPQYGGEFEWSRAFQGHVLSSYFYGYLSTIFLGGWLAGRYGGKHVIGVGLLVSSVATLLIPPAVRLNEYLIILLRVIIGAAAAPFVPSTLSLAGLWFSPSERSFLMAISRTGITMGSIVAFFISSQLCEVKIDNGWPMTFYVTGVAGVLFWVLWNVMVYSSPDHHPRISRREKEYIAASTGIKTSISQTTLSAARECLPVVRPTIEVIWITYILYNRRELIPQPITTEGCKVKRSKFPLFIAITCPAVWAIVFAQTSNTWFTFTALTSFPLYMRDVLRFNIKENGLFLILPHLLVIVTNIPAARLADLVIRRQLLRTVTVRRIIQTFASLTSSVLLVSLAFIDYDNRYIAVGLLTAISPVQSLCRSGHGVSALDFAPRYAGEIFGISSTFGTLSGILAPITVGYLTTNGTKQEWQIVFFIAAGMLATGATVFALCVKGTVLRWAADHVLESTTIPEKSDTKCESNAEVLVAMDSVLTSCSEHRPAADDKIGEVTLDVQQALLKPETRKMA